MRRKVTIVMAVAALAFGMAAGPSFCQGGKGDESRVPEKVFKVTQHYKGTSGT